MEKTPVSLTLEQPLLLLLLLPAGPILWHWWRTPLAMSPPRSRASLLLRALTLALLVLALAGMHSIRSERSPSVLFLLDRSLSTGSGSLDFQRTFIEDALAAAPADARYAVMLFGRDSALDTPLRPVDEARLAPFSAVIERDLTELTSAMRAAVAAFPSGTNRRIVLLSDGVSTESGSLEEAASLRASRVTLDTVALPQETAPEIALSELYAASEPAVDQPFLLTAVVQSRGIEVCELLLTEDGRPVQRLRLQLQEGPNLILLPHRSEREGPVRFEVRLSSPLDGRLENNYGEALVHIGSRPSVLIVRSEEASGSSPLRALLEDSGQTVREVTSTRLPTQAALWRDVDGLVLEDVSALEWEGDLQAMVALLVEDGGTGLLMTGGRASFGVGGYRGTPIEPLLPVALAVQRPQRKGKAGLMLVLDKSGSMGGDPIALAREAAVAAADSLSPDDLVGAVAFDSAARWLSRLAPRGDGRSFGRSVGRLRASGGTDLFPALTAAVDALAASDAASKHVLVLSDGAVAPAEFDALYDRARKSRITLSAVAFGAGADVVFLDDLAQRGGGRLYVVPDGSPSLPQVFIRDTLLATGFGFLEEEVAVTARPAGPFSGLLEGLPLERLPPLLGYTRTTERGGPHQVLLWSDRDDPILAAGRAGLGRTAAWTSDLGQEWAAPWQEDETLLSRLLLTTVREIQGRSSLGQRTGEVRLRARPVSRGSSWNVSFELDSRTPLPGPVEVRLISYGAGEEPRPTVALTPQSQRSARGEVAWNRDGSALAVASTLGGDVLALTTFSFPVAPELQNLQVDRQALQQLAERGGGRFDPSPQAVFEAPERPVEVRRALAPELTLLALLALILEIAVRRLPLPWHRPPSKPQTSSPSSSATRLTRLREAKAKAKANAERLKPNAPDDLKPSLRQRPKPLRWEEYQKGSSPAPPEPNMADPPAIETLERLKRSRSKRNRNRNR